MTLHIRKLCVGVERLEELQQFQARRLAQSPGGIWHQTRNWPRRQDEVLGAGGEEGGSLYWIIKGQMAARQRILGFEAAPRDSPDEKPMCRIMLEPKIVPTEPWPHRPFQGWRYLTPGEAPPDLADVAKATGLPADLAAELKARGLW
jgi:hypothetical protein